MNNLMEAIYQFFNHPFFILAGAIFTLIAIIGLFSTFVFWVLGITPLLYRLGLGRWLRKIAIAADIENYNNLRADLEDSGIFRKKNILQITEDHIAKIKDHDLILVYYKSFDEEQIKMILSYKKSKAGIIFYYPEFFREKGKKISEEMFKKINRQENSTIVNCRGRLLNDIITTLITTSYGKRKI